MEPTESEKIAIRKKLFWLYLEEDGSDPDMFFPPDTPLNSPKLYTRRRHHLKTKYRRMVDRLAQQQSASLRTLLNEFASTIQPELLPTPEVPTPRLLTGTDIPQSQMDLLAKFCNGETLPSPPSSSARDPNVLYLGLNQDPVKLQYQQEQEAIWNELLKGKLEEFALQAKVIELDHQASLAALEQARILSQSKPADAQPSTATRLNPSTPPSPNVRLQNTAGPSTTTTELAPPKSLPYRTATPLLFKKYLTTIGKLGTMKIATTNYFACNFSKNDKFLAETILLGRCDLFEQIARSKLGAQFENEGQPILVTIDNGGSNTLVSMQHRQYGELRIGTLKSIRAALNNPPLHPTSKLS
ncbi:hypothetical protein DM01DRAFT_325163 [Hesseltinella vesiculosa]|uniref:Uncharacterized protein n=1 Tax=Hesseltinella vesiculosa TaxID=101127 RepID=A0A1X2GNN2_9FUNG|nr:hypothetical protein DM01DRAFT_325163 [Hesseltinella vesiculosa]